MRTLEFSTRTAFACEAMLASCARLRAAIGHFVCDDQFMLGIDRHGGIRPIDARVGIGLTVRKGISRPDICGHCSPPQRKNCRVTAPRLIAYRVVRARR